MLLIQQRQREARTRVLLAWLMLSSCLCALAQAPQADQTPPPPPDPERWNLFYQATSIGQYHDAPSTSPYSGQFSLQNYPERDVSLTTTLFFALRLEQNTFLYFDPEIAGGRGFSGVDGLANSSNGELPRVASAEPKPYLARLYISHDFGFGDEKEPSDSDDKPIGGANSASDESALTVSTAGASR